MNVPSWGFVVLLVPLLVACGTSSPTPEHSPTPGPEVKPSGDSISLSGGNQSLPSIASVVEQVMPAVVSVNTEQVRLDFFYQVVVPGAGTGAIIRPDGYIVTNDHVIANAMEITVTISDGRVFPAKVVGRDPEGDIAVIKIDAQNLPTVAFGRSEKLQVGEWVIAVGNALGLQGGSTVTVGIVSALGRTILTNAELKTYLFDTIQTDAAINPGNSGGPLINLQGEVVGINTAIEGNAQGIGFAIAARIAEPTVASLIEHGRVVRPYIGVDTVTLTPSIARQIGVEVLEAIVVRATVPGTPAARAGLQRLDIIVTLNNEPVAGEAEFRRVLWKYRPGDVVAVEYIREGETRSVELTLGERPSTVALGGENSLV